jgi:hypothetical protein
VELTIRSPRWEGDERGRGIADAATFVAETASYVRQRRDDGVLVFEFVTGMGGDDSHFSPHGHAVRFRVDRAG